MEAIGSDLSDCAQCGEGTAVENICSASRGTMRTNAASLSEKVRLIRPAALHVYSFAFSEARRK